MIQLTRSGLRVSSPDEVGRLAETFARCHAVRLPQFLEPALLDTVSRAVAASRFAERIHDELDPPAVDLRLDDMATHGRLLVLFNDAVVTFLESVRG